MSTRKERDDYDIRHPYVKSLKKEGAELIKNVAALVTAISVIGGTLSAFWVWIGGPVPLSIQQHSKDLAAISSKLDKFFTETTRVNRINRIEILRTKLANLNNELTRTEDTVALHQRAINSKAVGEPDKIQAESRIRALNNAAGHIREQMKETEDEIKELLELLRASAPLDNVEKR